MYCKWTVLFGAGIILFSINALSQSPIGEWYAYDDNCIRRSIVRIYEKKDKTLAGKVVKLLNPPEGKHKIKPLCTECPGDKKGKPKVGMDIFWGLEKTPAKQGLKWEDGSVVNTDDGRTYSAKLWMETKDRLIFRGHLWLFGKNIHWTRVPKDGSSARIDPEKDPTVPKECISQHKKMVNAQG